MAKTRGPAPVPSRPGDDDDSPSGGPGDDGEDRTSPNDPQVEVATMEH